MMEDIEYFFCFIFILSLYFICFLTLTRFTTTYSEIFFVDDAILIIFVRREIHFPHLIRVIVNLLDYWWKARNINRSCYFVIVGPLPIHHFVDMPHLKNRENSPIIILCYTILCLLYNN